MDRGLKRSRRLELESEPGLKRRLLEKKVGTARLPTSDSAGSQIVPVKSQKLEDEGIESGSTSSEFGVERTAGRERGLRKRPRRGLRTFCGLPNGSSSGMPLASRGGGRFNEGEGHLQQEVEGVVGCGSRRRAGEMFNHLFKEGEGSSTGDYILAALIDRFPQFGKLGSRKIPRSMAGSARLEKVVPISLAACLPPRDLVRHQLEDGRSRAFGKGCLQPPPGLDLPSARSSVEASQDGPGAADKGCDWQLVSGDKFERNRRCVRDWHEGRFSAGGLELALAPVRGATFPGTVEREAMDRVWEFDYSQYLSVFHDCCSDLKLSLVPYQARHSGPSIDRSTNVRTQEEVRKKGGWQSRQSVARYEKSGRLAATWQGLNQSVQLACRSAERYIEEIMLGRDFPDIPLPGQ